MRNYKHQNLWQGCVGAWCPSQDRSRSTLVTDFSGFGRHLTMTNMDPGTDWVASNGDIALDFDGTNDYVTGVPASLFQSKTTISIALWFKKFSTGTAITCGSQSLALGAMDIQIWSDGNIYISPTVSTAYGSIGFNDTLWHHLVAVYDGTGSTNADRLKLYLDGLAKTLSFTGTIASSMNASAAAWDIGRDASASSRGLIDDVRIYSRALTSHAAKLLATRRGIAYEVIRSRRAMHRASTSSSGRTMLVGCGL